MKDNKKEINVETPHVASPYKKNIGVIMLPKYVKTIHEEIKIVEGK